MVGRPRKGSRTRQVALQRLPLTGRNAELGVIRKAFTSARVGRGPAGRGRRRAGIGKTRLLEALRDAAAGFRKLHATCEAYTASTPYAVWRELLREMHGLRPRRSRRGHRGAICAEVVDAQRPTSCRGCR